jgi:hypothetical protein
MKIKNSLRRSPQLKITWARSDIRHSGVILMLIHLRPFAQFLMGTTPQ